MLTNINLLDAGAGISVVPARKCDAFGKLARVEPVLPPALRPGDIVGMYKPGLAQEAARL